MANAIENIFSPALYERYPTTRSGKNVLCRCECSHVYRGVDFDYFLFYYNFINICVFLTCVFDLHALASDLI